MNTKIILLAALCLMSSACMKIKDKEKFETNLPDLIVDRPMHLYGKELVTTDELQLLQKTQEKVLANQKITMNVHSLKFSNNSKITTYGADLTIIADEIVGDAVIETFPEGQTALDYLDGRHGGLVRIKASSLMGSLVVFLRGEHGGKGKPGREPDASLKGEDGAFEKVGCTHTLTNTGIGQNGKPGYKGGTGYRGGDSGTAIIRLGSFTSEPVIDRKKGNGGLGGEGGLGGDPGATDYRGYDCSPIYYGTYPRAVRGSFGPEGDRGPDGEITY